jgi:hypothetical protein
MNHRKTKAEKEVNNNEQHIINTKQYNEQKLHSINDAVCITQSTTALQEVYKEHNS